MEMVQGGNGRAMWNGERHTPTHGEEQGLPRIDRGNTSGNTTGASRTSQSNAAPELGSGEHLRYTPEFSPSPPRPRRPQGRGNRTVNIVIFVLPLVRRGLIAWNRPKS